jgi:hypothetical protein
MKRHLFWNSWELTHPFPIVDYKDGEKTAHVRYSGREATLPAGFRREGDIRYNGATPQFIDKGESRLSIDGFAARFPKGRRIWNARLDFIRADGEAEWSICEVNLYDGPPSSAPPQVIGFLKDFPAKDRGVGGRGRKVKLRHRARVGLPEGPVTADDFHDAAMWGFAKSLWFDEAKDPFETAKILGAPVLALLRKFGTPGNWVHLLEDEGTGA